MHEINVESLGARKTCSSASSSLLPQWNGGGGRDSDVDLMALTRWWFDRRDQCRAVTRTSAASEGGASAGQGSSPSKDSAQKAHNTPQMNSALESFWAQGCNSLQFILM